MIVRFSPGFYETLKKVNVRVRKAAKEKILLFSKNPNNSQLHNHKLQKEYIGYRSINITADYRAIYEEKKEGKSTIAYFILLGTHRQYIVKKS